MKPGDLVVCNYGGYSGGGPGIILDIEHAWDEDTLFVVFWFNDYSRTPLWWGCNLRHFIESEDQ